MNSDFQMHPDSYSVVPTRCGDAGVGPIPNRKILHITDVTPHQTGPRTTRWIAETINADGSGLARSKGIPFEFSISKKLAIGNAPEISTVNRNRPNQIGSAPDDIPLIQLPYDRGRLIKIKRWKDMDDHWVLIRPSGEIIFLDKEISFENTVTFNADGSLFSTLFSKDNWKTGRLKIIRTDGKLFKKTGKPTCDLMNSAVPYHSIDFRSVSFAGEKVWFVSGSRLFSAPADCSSHAEAVKLPHVNGKVIAELGKLLVSGGMKYIIVVAGPDTKKEDILLINVKTLQVRNITNDPQPRLDSVLGGKFGMLKRPNVAVSPGGGKVAYFDVVDSRYELLVRPVTTEAPAFNATDRLTFADAIDDFYGIYWATDDDLTFWAGDNYNKLDLYHLRVSAKEVTNLTRTGGVSKPFSVAGKLRPWGGWRSPNGKYTYYMYCREGQQSFCNVAALRNGDRKIIGVAENLTFHYTPRNLEASVYSPHLVFFHALDRTGNDTNLYFFDQNSATSAKKLTNFWGLNKYGNEIRTFMPGNHGAHVAFEEYPSSYAQSIVGISLAGPTVTQLASEKGHFMRLTGFSPCDDVLVWGATEHKDSWLGTDLRVSSIDGKNTKVLLTKKAVRGVLAVY